MSNFFDRCGMTVSGLCGIHCVLLVAISILQPAIFVVATYAPWLRSLEIFFALLAGLFAAIAFLSGYRHHGHLKPVLLGGAGLAGIFASVFSPLHDSPWASAITVFGGAALIVGHKWNIKCRCAHAAEKNKAPEGALKS